jgi:UDP-N-acetyl-D-glucosamine dehydrogenase
MKSKKNLLIKKIENKDIKVAVIGLGHVGLPLSIHIAESGIPVIGIEKNKNKIEKLKRYESYILDIKNERIESLIKSKKFIPKEKFNISLVDVIIICVPTPLTPSKEPDVSYLVEAGNVVAKFLRPLQLISIESTSYPGTTEELILPILNKKKLKVGIDFFLVFSPERLDPGNKTYNIKNTPKVIAGVTQNCTQVGIAFYSKFVDKLVPVSSCKVAEIEKLFENVFRNVNIALVNEFTMLCHKMGIDVWEVIEAASTKPYGFMPFYPGPGIGGHCIPLDPSYLSWKAKQFDFHTKFIELADEINSQMPEYVVNRTIEEINKRGKSINNSKILILGLAYKNDINDARESPSIKLIKIFEEKNANVNYNDPFIPYYKVNERIYKSIPLTKEILRKQDCVIISTAHNCYDYSLIVKESKLIIDTRNALKQYKNKNIVKL